MMKSLLPREHVLWFLMLHARLLIDPIEIKLVAGNFVDIGLFHLINSLFVIIYNSEFIALGVPCERVLFVSDIIFPTGIVGIEAVNNVFIIIVIAIFITILAFPRADKSCLLCSRILLPAVTIVVFIVTAGHECKGEASQYHKNNGKTLSKKIFHKLYV